MTNLINDKKQVLLNRPETDLSSLLSNPDKGVWELIFESLPDMVALIDLNNIIVKANKVMRQKLSIGDKRIVGRKCYTLMHENGCAVVNCPHLSMLNDRNPHSIELFEPKVGSYLNISTTPIFDADNNMLGSLHIARDISNQKESETKLNEYNAELKELNLNRDKFFSILAHDLRSPFQGMLGFTDLILAEIDQLSKDEIKRYLQKVHDSAYSTFSLLENLLNWSRLQSGRLPFNPANYTINQDISSVTRLLGSNAQSKNISIINNIVSDYQVFADHQMVHSILLNLITNAIKFTHPGGTVIIDAKIKSQCEDLVDGKSACLHNCLEISVTDTGVGIPDEGLEQLFKDAGHFTHSGTANEQGAGLGLILVKEMTEKHGGKLSVISQEGKGSVFTFSLPVAVNEKRIKQD